MLSLPSAVRIFVCTKPVDMRYAFDRLAMLTESILLQDPFSGHLFVFYNKNRDKLKILLWDRTGLVIYYKRLEQGTFRFLSSDDSRMELNSADLLLILEGIDLNGARRLKRYTRGGEKNFEKQKKIAINTQ